MKYKFIIIGAGGHAKVVLDTLRQAKKACNVVAAVDCDSSKLSATLLGLDILSEKDLLYRFPVQKFVLANGLGSLEPGSQRVSIYTDRILQGYQFPSFQHISATVSVDVQLAIGVQIMAGAIIQPDVRIDENTIINTGAIVDHDCCISKHVHIGPGAVLSGGVFVGQGSHIGCGATILQGVKVGENCLVGAGSVVTDDVSDGDKVIGVPARSMVV